LLGINKEKMNESAKIHKINTFSIKQLNLSSDIITKCHPHNENIAREKRITGILTRWRSWGKLSSAVIKQNK
jgi:hypothetical protein